MYYILLLAISYLIWVASKSKNKPGESDLRKIMRTYNELSRFVIRFVFSNIYNIIDNIERLYSKDGPERGGREQDNKKSSYNLSVDEAQDILGISSTATEKEINSAFKRMIILHHPDKGGSKYVAKKIIGARDLLISMKRNKSTST